MGSDARPKTIVLVCGALMIGCAVAWFAVRDRQSPGNTPAPLVAERGATLRSGGTPRSGAVNESRAATTGTPTPQPTGADRSPGTRARPSVPGGAPNVSPSLSRTTPGQESSLEEPLIPHLVARRALSLVGADADANMIWWLAINDPGLPPHVRQDLIEDLNEEGFPDPENITKQDLPLIRSRLAMIERLGAFAMDETNAAAFQEAYKDLANMLARVGE